MSLPARASGRSASTSRVLFLSHNGLTSHIGQSQVLPYLLGLARRGHEIVVVAFENKQDHHAVDLVREQIGELPLTWLAQPFSRLPGPLGKYADHRRMTRTALQCAREFRPNIVHCRSYVPADAALAVKRSCGARLLFDTRGFWVDQRAEGRRWPQESMPYRVLYRQWKRKELEYFRQADAVVCLTHAAHDHIVSLIPDASVHVIPCAVDYDKFGLDSATERESTRDSLGVRRGQFLIVYLGSLGSVYMLDEMLIWFHAMRRDVPDAVMLFIGRDGVAPLMKRATELGCALPEGAILVRRVPHAEVPSLLNAADAGLCFIIPTFSSKGVSPTKLGEYFACGLPVVCNSGVGDVDQIVASTGGGVILQDPLSGDPRPTAIIETLRSVSRSSLRSVSRGLLDLDVAVESYEHVYQSLS